MTIRSVSDATCSIACTGEIISSLRPLCLTLSISGEASVVFSSITIFTDFSHAAHKAYIPSEAPRESRSEKRWPIISTLPLPDISSDTAEATMRLFTLVRFSTPLETPP